VNRSGLIDSKVSLDYPRELRDSLFMIQQPYHLYTERTDPSKNMARYYALEISETLFGEPCLTRRWGRIGASGQSLVHHFEKEGDAVRLFLDLMREKRARGYRPRTIGGTPSH
jgi:predicted DNA-binding WGR domain protein